MLNQGFSAEIPEPYLLTLQSSLHQADSPIAYIGKAVVVSSEHCYLLISAILEPDSTVTTQG